MAFLVRFSGRVPSVGPLAHHEVKHTPRFGPLKTKLNCLIFIRKLAFNNSFEFVFRSLACLGCVDHVHKTATIRDYQGPYVRSSFTLHHIRSTLNSEFLQACNYPCDGIANILVANDVGYPYYNLPYIWVHLCTCSPF